MKMLLHFIGVLITLVAITAAPWAAASILSQGGPEQRQAVEKLLQDPNPEIRLAAALASAQGAGRRRRGTGPYGRS
jgi:hypothetical protein